MNDILKEWRWWGKEEEKLDIEIPVTPQSGSITNITFSYGKSQSSIDPSTVSVWSDTIPQVSSGEFLWTRVKIEFTDGTSKFEYTVSTQNAISVISTTYEQLGEIINNNSLLQGLYYRITDYVATTSDSNSSAENHQFDIIVQAIDNHTLSNTAMAAHHSGDTYFESSRLDCWELKYSFYNDDSLFEWADTVNGKGVIYYMKDEFGNECPYDFKNIKFKNDTNHFYTFSSYDGAFDKTMDGNANNNIIGAYIESETHKLNGNIFLGENIVNNILGLGCYSNIFNTELHEFKLGNNCHDNNFGKYCYGFEFANNCHHNIFGKHCESIKMDIGSSTNKFGDYCHHNHIGNNCYNITVGDDFRYATFGNDSHHITFVKEDGTTLVPYIYNVEIGQAVHWVKFKFASETYEGNKLQNIRVAQGIEGSRFEDLEIELTVSAAFPGTWDVAKNSSGTIKQFCIADVM